MLPKKVWGLCDPVSCSPDTFLPHKFSYLKGLIICSSVIAYVSFLPFLICHNMKNYLTFIKERDFNNLAALQAWVKARFWSLFPSNHFLFTMFITMLYYAYFLFTILVIIYYYYFLLLFNVKQYRKEQVDGTFLWQCAPVWLFPVAC